MNEKKIIGDILNLYKKGRLFKEVYSDINTEPELKQELK